MLSPDQHGLLPLLPQQDTTYELWVLQVQKDDIPSTRLYVPHQVVEAAHQFLGHAGINATSHFCRLCVFMFCLVPEVRRIIRHCHPCQLKDQKAPKQKDTYRHSVQAGAPFQAWSMDVLGPLRVSWEGNKYLLTLKAVFSKRFEAIPCYLL